MSLSVQSILTDSGNLRGNCEKIIPEKTLFIVCDAPPFWNGKAGDKHVLSREPILNGIMGDELNGCENVDFVNMQSIAVYPDYYHGIFHFTRPVYQRAAEIILEKFETWSRCKVV